MEKRGKNAQVWVETVIYTLIGLAIIGILIAVITPKINDMKDKAIITQTINSLNDINQQIQNTFLAPGNKRGIDVVVKKGEYVLDASGNSIYYVLRGTKLVYSQINQSQKQADISILTVESGSKYNVFLTLNYSDLNITYQNKDTNRILTAAPTAYGLLVENVGGEPTQINIEPK